MLMEDCYGWANFYTHSLGKLGYEVWEPVGNAEIMQKRWAAENGIAFDEKNWLMDIATAQVEHFQPDIVFVNDYMTYSFNFLANIREKCPSIRLVFGWCGAPYYDESVFKAYDVVMSNILPLVRDFREKGHRSEYMCHAFEPKVLEKTTLNGESRTEFSFIGSIARKADFHIQREALLKKLAEETDLQMWLHVGEPSEREIKRQRFRQRKFDLVQSAKKIPGGRVLLGFLPGLRKYVEMEKRPLRVKRLDEAIVSRAKPPLFGVSMYNKLGSSLVTLNTHIDLSGEYASNMRLFEATGMGACLLTDWKPNLHELFEPDEEVVTYRDPEEAVEKVQYLLTHEETRKRIARMGQQRTLKNHTYDIRAHQLHELAKKMIDAA
jgi:glycosyltransferase involved in cell wall biosynthesis